MLTKEDNEIINHVGPGTPMGNLLRRYWTPALLSNELPVPDCNPMKVRILGEDLVAFRDTGGNVGLVDANCPHRGTGLFFGRNEEGGLRCVYHGFKFDVTGQCVDMPSEPPTSNFREKLKVPAYLTHESGGIVWTYMGPKDKLTGFRDFGTEGLPREKWRANKRFQPLTWMQLMEGSLDTTHPSWLHMWGGAKDVEDDGSDAPGTYCSMIGMLKFWWQDRAPEVKVIEDWHGFRGVGLRRTPNGNTFARLYSYIIPYNAGSGGSCIVPIDDDTSLNFSFATVRNEIWNELVLDAKRPASERLPPGYPLAEDDGVPRNLANDYLIDREKQRDGTIYSGLPTINIQDVMARQTSFTDRTKEHLGTLDRKIILMRRLLIKAAKDLARGIEPPALDPSLPFDRIGSPSKVLAPGEDWTILGSDRDPNPTGIEQTIALPHAGS